MTLPRRLGQTSFVLSAMLLGCGGALLTGCSTDGPSPLNVAATETRDHANDQPNGQSMGEALVEGLTATEGCLGAVGAQVRGGKLSILAWFEDKAAAVRWYESPTHRRFQGMLNAGGPAGEPMAHVDDDTPIMVIATITPAEPGKDYGLGMPFKQISIELFQPLPGGAHVNGRLSPDAFPVEHMREFKASRPADD